MTTNDAAAGWSAVAAAWDMHAEYVDSHSLAATERQAERLKIAPGDRILELAAGPGSLGALWSRLVGSSGQVVLSDIAPEMVEVARRRNADHTNVFTRVIDASAIAEDSASFDVVVCRMGLQFTPDPAVALSEIHRVLDAGGRVGIMTWAAMEHNPWMTCVGMAAMVSGIATGGPPTGPGTIFSLGDPDRLEALLNGAGFNDIVVDTEEVVFTAPDIDVHVTRVGSLAGALAPILHAASPDQQAAMRRTAADLAAAYRTDTGYEIPGRIVSATAVR